MRFRIIRASNEAKKPCKEAYKGTREIYFKGNVIIDDCWYIDINSLEELLKLIKKYGDLIIQKEDDNNKKLLIMIYDDYIEGVY